MTPVFTEKESNGIYEATLKITMETISGPTNLGNKFTLDLNSLTEREKTRLSDLNLSLKAIAVQVDVFLEQEKKNGISNLYKLFNERIEHEQKYLNEKDK